MVDSILTPENSTCEQPLALNEQQYYIIDNYLSELETEAQKGIARENLGVYGKQDLYTQIEVDNSIAKAVNDAVKAHLLAEDPHQILPEVSKLITDYVRKDGTTPFTAPQVGVDPLLDSHLTTKRYVSNLLDSHLKKTDPHNVMDLVNEVLKSYALSKNVYSKSEVYTKSQTDKAIKNFVRTDGTTPFTAPQSGVTPVADQHLATKRYIDNLLFKHEVNADPHGFITILNQRLSKYYKTTETYSKAETYSRAQIDQVINTLVTDAAYQALREHKNQFDPHNILKEVYKEHYVKRDGSIPFTSIQKGIEGIEDNDLATVSQINRVREELSNDINKSQPIWITSGPVQTTVGFVEDESSLPSVMNLQEIMDAIFYGKAIDVVTASSVAVGQTVSIAMHIRGNALIQKAELYQNEVLIGTYTRDNFLDWVYTVESQPVLVNTTFTFKVTYDNGVEQTATSVTNVAYGIFVGAVSRACKPGDLRYNVMLELTESDPENNKMYSYGEEVDTIKHKFNFTSPSDPKVIVLALPADYKPLYYMHTASQHFGVEAFDIETVPVLVPGVDEPILFTYYMYNESLIAFNSEIIFKLNNNE